MVYYKLRVIFAAILLTLSSFLSATTYYVSPTGDGNGTFTSPLSFSSSFAKTLVPGDSLVLRGGIYSFNAKQTFSKSGSSASFIHIVSFSNEIPILDFRSEPYSSTNPGVSLSGNYVHFKGITVQGAGDNGLYVSGSNNYIEFCVFRWNCDSGLQMKTGSNNLIENCDSYENFDYQTGGISVPNFGGNADGFADKQYTNTGTNRYKGCRSWRNSDDGWDHYQKIGNTSFDSCWCYANGPANYDMKNNIRFKTDSATWFVNFASTNYVVKNYGNGNGFKLGGEYTAHNAVLHHCVSVLNTVKGFDQNNNNGSMTVYNCSGYANKPDYGFSNGSYGALIIKNCATLGTKSSNSLGAKTVTQSNNSWNSGFSCTSADFQSVDYTQMLSTRQPNGALPETTFLHLKSTSTMIDKGLNIGYTFSGTAPDLGAYEYGLISAMPKLVSNNGISVYFSESQNALIFKGTTTSVYIYNIIGEIIYANIIATDDLVISTIEWNKGVYIILTKSNLNISSTLKTIIR